jgi:hypothetical protein
LHSRDMRRKIIIVTVLVAIGAVVAGLLLKRFSSRDGFDLAQNRLPQETKKVLEKGERFLLLSLDPTHPDSRQAPSPQPKEMFHDYAVLGKTEISDAVIRAELLRALYKGIADSDGVVAACFNPRHGISATLGSETVDLVICFECLSIETHAKMGKNVLTTRSPEPTFNRALKRARLPVAKER